ATLDKLKNLLPDCNCRAGAAAIVDLAVETGADIMLCAIVGTSGVLPVLRALENHIPVALASKEVLVMAGEMVMAASRKYQTPIIPVDSEHSAIFQCLQSCRKPEEVKSLVLTASGGAFINLKVEELQQVDFKAALQHPVWKMGPKVTIDSASLMNKALEMIEAHHLFNVPEDKIKVVIHRQSVIHSMVEFVDGALLAQMSVPDMRFAIQYALSHPMRVNGNLPEFDFAKFGQISFELPDAAKYPALDLGRRAMRIGGTMPTVLNAANEVAVERFKQGAVKFPDIWKIVTEAMDKHHAVALESL
ncbi:MAG: 1-deoxy-D-xylulose-5-phosphate reductoisomerase, partial [Victivallaceae bacterium]